MKKTAFFDKDLKLLDFDKDIKEELTLYRKLNPLLGECLTLNHDLNNPLAGIL